MPLKSGVRTIKKTGSAALRGDVTLSAGLNITLNQVGQDIELVAAAGGTPADTVTDERTFGLATAVGTSTDYARKDHTHGSPTEAAVNALAAVEAAAAVVTHVALADPHVQYQKESEKDAALGYAGLSATTKLAGAQQTYGSGVNTACEGNDARLSDDRTPTVHDILTKHNGFPGGTTNFLRADGTFAAPPAGGSPPTGTGFRHITSGVEDAAAKLVDTADVNDGQITPAKIADIATSRLLGRVTAGTGDVEVLTGTQATTLLDTFTSSLKGLAPLSGGGTSNFLRADGTWAAPAGGSTPPWKGVVVACVSDGDPDKMLGRLLHNPVHATPTNIGLSVARISYFKLDTAITVANIRFFGVGATTAVYHIAVYRDSDSVRMSGDLNPNTAAQAWGVAASSFTLAANVLYFAAVGIDTTGTTAGIACCSGTTGRIGVLPTGWPGSLDIDAASPKINPFGFAQFAVTNGAMPATAPARALQAAWTGGMPAIFLDSV